MTSREEERRIEANIGGDARKRCPFDHRPDIVDDEPSHRRFGLCRHYHSEQTAHRRTDPRDAIGASVREQRRQRGKIGRERIIIRITQPFAIAAARHIGTQEAEAPGKTLRQHVEVSSVAGQAVHACHNTRVVGVSPLAIHDAMKSVRAEAFELMASRGDHAGQAGTMVAQRIVGENPTPVNRCC